MSDAPERVEQIDHWFAQHHFDAVLTHTADPACCAALDRAPAPVVNLALDDPRFAIDEAATGRLAAEHLFEQGLRHFAAVTANHHLAPARLAGYLDALERRGQDVAVLRPGNGASYQDQVQQMREFLATLPRPCGIFTFNDHQGSSLLRHASDLDLAVPAELAVVGVDNDDLSCLCSMPPLSSVALPHHEQGRRAAMILEARLARDRLGELSPLAPSGLVVRESSDRLAVEDEVASRAIRHIREHLDQTVDIADLATACDVARSTLERRLRQSMDLTPQALIQRCRVEQARRLLGTTTMPVTQIALAVGFSHPGNLTRAFRQHCGCTPKEWRRRTGG